MRIFNQKRTKEYQLSELDLDKGRLTSGRLIVTDVNGNKSTEHILIYRRNVNKSKEYEIEWLKGRLDKTDYQAIKILERIIDILVANGLMSAEEYAEMKAKRQDWRDRINDLEALIAEEKALIKEEEA